MTEQVNDLNKQDKVPLSKRQLSKYLDESTKARKIFTNQSKTRHSISSWLVNKWGTLGFALFHLIFLSVWFFLNQTQYKFDPFPHPFLNLLLSIEAIFLFIFVLMNQENQQRIAEKIAEMNLHFTVIAESENTQILKMLQAILKNQNIDYDDPDIEGLSKRVKPHKVAELILTKQAK